MLEEFTRVELVTNIPEHGLYRGATGTIVDMHRDPDAYLVEFTAGGKTVAIVSVRPEQVRALVSDAPVPARARNVAAR